MGTAKAYVFRVYAHSATAYTQSDPFRYLKITLYKNKIYMTNNFQICNARERQEARHHGRPDRRGPLLHRGDHCERLHSEDLQPEEAAETGAR